MFDYSWSDSKGWRTVSLAVVVSVFLFVLVHSNRFPTRDSENVQVHLQCPSVPQKAIDLGGEKENLQQLKDSGTACQIPEIVTLNASRHWRTRLEISMALMGRLGNQLFEVFSVLGICIQNRCSSAGFTGDSLQDVFELFPTLQPCLVMLSRSQSEETQAALPTSSIHESNWGIFGQELLTLPLHHRISLSGYLQSWRYFPMFSRHRLLEMLHPQRLANARAEIQRLKQDHGVSCIAAVHVRRGDNLHQPKYWLPDAQWLNNAMNFLQTQSTSPCAFIVLTGGSLQAGISDGESIQWCSSNLDTTRFKIVDVRSDPVPLNDLFTMIAADHVIITTGTFGWWGAYLNDGIKIACQDFFAYHDQYSCRDHFPVDWHLFNRNSQVATC
eukprot:ANDGO_05975.mRNA.1 Galactoside 2-alpha-L-fucosyltransferase 2 OS=Hylobates lar GN=FUT2 PE=3 SV=1